MTPVLDGRTLCAPSARLSSFATAPQRYSELATPSPPEHTFETLLFIMIVWIGFPDDSRERPTLIGDPGNYEDKMEKMSYGKITIDEEVSNFSFA